MEIAKAEMLFISDVVQELDAAAAAGFQTALSIRPGNARVKTLFASSGFSIFGRLRSRKSLNSHAER